MLVALQDTKYKLLIKLYFFFPSIYKKTMIRILVVFEKRRKIVNVLGTDFQDLKAAVFAEFDGILLPQSKIIFQKWDEEFGEYVDFEEDSILKDKDKVQVLQDLSVNCLTSTPMTEVSDFILCEVFPVLRMQIGDIQC